MRLGKYYKIKCEDVGTLEMVKDAMSRNGITWGQKAVGKPIHVWSTYNQDSLEAMLDEKGIRYKISAKNEKTFNSKDYSSVYFNETQFIDPERTNPVRNEREEEEENER